MNSRKLRVLLRISGAIFAACCFELPARATLLVYDGFSCPTRNLSLPLTTASSGTTKTQRLRSTDPTPVTGLAQSDWADIRAAYEAKRHAFVPVAGGWQARNPGQQWLMTFDGRGFVAEPSGGEWHWGLELKNYGFPGHERALVGKSTVRARGQRLAYEWDAALEEWFVNDARGLDHGFTLRERPTANSGGRDPLQFDLAVRGPLKAHVEGAGRSVGFRDAAGTIVLTYTDLKVWDADGKALAARFAPTAASGASALCLLVEERGARYPITVDPIAQQAYLKASNTGSSDLFGFSVAVSGDTVVVGAPYEDGSGTGVNPPDNLAPDAGAAYVFVRSGTNWSQQAYLKAANTEAGDQFGAAVAVSGDTIVVGARLEDGSATGVNPPDNNNLAPDAGAAYVFVRSGTTWSQQAYLKAANTDPYVQFGFSAAISGDTVVVGAHYENSVRFGSGAAYVYVRTGTTWSYQAILKASNAGSNDRFGESVAVADDTVIVGAPSEQGGGFGINPPDDNLANQAGAAYVFVRSGTSWTQQAYLKASNPEAADFFGNSVGISGDTVVVGAPNEAGSGTGVNPPENNLSFAAGAAYVFVRSGTNWSQQAYLKAFNTGANDTFGSSVAVSGDTVVVGAYQEDGSGMGVAPADNDNAHSAGAVYVYVRSGAVWGPPTYLKASNAGAPDQFGFSVAVSGGTLVVGSPNEQGTGTGVNPPDNNLTIAAGAAYTFALPVTITITTSASPAAGGSTSGGGTYAGGASVTVVATANPGYAFVNWTEGGTPVSTLATYTFTASASRTLVANFAACPTISIDPVTLPDGAPDISYNQPVTASGGTGPYTYSVTGGSLPPGVALSSDGTISGTPTAGGNFNFRITAREANGCTGARDYALHVTCRTITVGPASLPDGTPEVAYPAQTITPSGGTAPYYFTRTSGMLPPGLTLSGDGTISGTPTAGGDFNFTVTATDAYGCTVSRVYTLHVTCPAIVVNPAGLPDGMRDVSYTQTTSVSGGTGPYTYAVTGGTLPPGLALSGDTLSGTPAVGGDFNFTITATDTYGCTGSRSYTLHVSCPAITVNPATLPNRTLSAFYAQSISATGGTGPYLYFVSSGSLPSGLTLVDGILSGTPTVGGNFSFTITAADAFGCAGSRSYTLRIQSLAISCPPAVVVQCSGEVPPVATNVASFVAQGGSLATDCGPPTLVLLDQTVAGDCPKTITRTYRATDTCDAQMDCTQIITVHDTTDPDIDDAGPTLVVECTDPLFTPPAPTATDNCDLHPRVEEFGGPWAPDSCPNVYTKVFKWRAIDACGNVSRTVSQSIKVHDTTPPVPTNAVGSLDRTVETGDSAAIDAAYALQPGFVDGCEGPVTPSPAVVTSVPDGSCETGNAVERRWRAMDRCGNVSDEFVQRITLVDTTLPTITCPDNIMVITGPGPVDFTATAEDNVDPAPMIICDHPPRSTFPMGVTTVRCKARDRCGNESAECSFTVTVSAIGCTAAHQEAYVKASFVGVNHNFGQSVAIDGDTMVSGAPNQETIGDPRGFVYIFVHDSSGDAWSQQAAFTSSPILSGTEFGASVAISGNTIVIGAPGNSAGSGGAYVLVRDGSGDWSPQGYLTASNPEADDRFGFSVAISGDMVVVGAPGEGSNFAGVQNVSGSTPEQENNGAPVSGAAYVFVRTGSTWTQQAYLKASNTGAGDGFGASVAISGNAIVIGAPREQSNFAGVQNTASSTSEQANNSLREAGACYVFRRNPDGTWAQQAYLKSSRPSGGFLTFVPGGQFGQSVAISGERLVVGAPWDNHLRPSAGSGAGEVFVRTAGSWLREARIENPSVSTLFARSVGISGDTVVIGNPGDSSSNGDPSDTRALSSGAAYTFIRSGSAWVQQAYFKASNIDAGDSFGVAVGISGDTVVVGADHEDSNFTGVQNGSEITPEQRDNSRLDSGAAYVFRIENEPCAHDDSFFVPLTGELTIPIDALLGNDAHSRGLPIFFSGHYAATIHGAVITEVGSPPTALRLPAPPPLPPNEEDSFTYRVTDGTHEAMGVVHFTPADLPAPPPNKLALFPPPTPGGGLTILFNAPAAGTYALERKTLAIPGGNSSEGSWNEVTRAIPTAPGVTTFLDARLPSGAIYRVRRVP